jgi:hypothetical protein
MAAQARTRSPRSSHPPLWLVEGLDILQRKAIPFGITVAVVVLGAALLALVAPGLLPATPAIGATIGVAALLLGVAVAVATDASDLTVRGPRHVAAAGGELVAVLPRDPSVAAAGPLATAIVEVRDPGSPLLLAFATASRDARRANAWTEAIARALVADGCGVLRVDLASGRSEQPGLVEVVRDGQRLADVVTFQPGMKLAEMTAGRDHTDALAALTELPARLPRDLDILLVSLPTAANRGVVAAATALDHVLVVVERDRTSRVDLIASLDALGAAGTQAQVVLLDTQTAMRLAPPVVAAPDAEAAERRAIASTVGTPPVVELGSDGEPVPVPDEELEDTEEELEDEPGGEADASLDEELLDEDERAPEDELASSIDAALADEVPEPEDADDGILEPAGEAADEGPDAVEPDPVDDRDLRDTAVLTAAAAATGLSIADAEQGLTGELPLTEAAPEPTDERELEDAEPEPEPELALEAEPEPEPEPERELELEPERESEPESEPEPDPQPETESELEPEPEPEPELDPEPDDEQPPAQRGDEPEHVEELPVAGEEPRVEPVVQLDLDEDIRPAGVSAPTHSEADRSATEPEATTSRTADPVPDVEEAEADATDRLPRVTGTGGAPEPDPFEDADDDLLHTTARLAILTQDVAIRDAGGDDHLDADAGTAVETNDTAGEPAAVEHDDEDDGRDAPA